MLEGLLATWQSYHCSKGSHATRLTPTNIMTSRFSFSRRLLGVLLALAVGASSAEALSSELRDSDIHHEGLAKATASHDMRGAEGIHGHGDAPSKGAHEHGPGQAHGTSADHCTHVHGQGLVMPVGFVFTMSMAEWGFVEPLFHTAFPTGTLKHPPRV